MKSFNSKVLLLGEHTVVQGGRALAIPFSLMGGQWLFNKGVLDRNLVRFADYLDHHNDLFKIIDVDCFFADLDHGMFFESNITQGKGLGSSGALVAATFDRYKKGSTLKEAADLIYAFSEMESFFHGKSSGFDPMVSYFNNPVLLENKNIKLLPDLNMKQEGLDFCLIDTKVIRSTKPFVQAFSSFILDPKNIKMATEDYLPFIDAALDALLFENPNQLWASMCAISGFQYAYLDFLIDEGSRSFWKEGLASDYFKVKICGAGGGGYLLAITKDFDQLVSTYPNRLILKLR